jgi:hypothetical protein
MTENKTSELGKPTVLSALTIATVTKLFLLAFPVAPSQSDPLPG